MDDRSGELLEFVVREAVTAGMGTELRGPILDGVEEGRGIPVKESRRAPIAVVFLATSFVTGYLLGRRSVRQKPS